MQALLATVNDDNGVPDVFPIYILLWRGQPPWLSLVQGFRPDEEYLQRYQTKLLPVLREIMATLTKEKALYIDTLHQIEHDLADILGIGFSEMVDKEPDKEFVTGWKNEKWWGPFFKPHALPGQECSRRLIS